MKTTQVSPKQAALKLYNKDLRALLKKINQIFLDLYLYVDRRRITPVWVPTSFLHREECGVTDTLLFESSF